MPKRFEYENRFRDYPDVLTIRELAAMLGDVSTKTAATLLRNDKIKHFHIGVRYLIPKTCVIDFIPGANIDYPVMQTVDEPNYYLKRGFDKQYSDYGVPYVQENCDLALSDNCVIYGHHMNNGSMFADLCKYESEDFYQEHKIIRFDTLSGFGEYEIVAVFKTVAYSEQGFKYYHFTRAESAADFDAYIAQCKAHSLYDTGVTAEYGDKLITLSTCEYSRKNGRMVVVAKRITAPSAEVGSDEA